MSELLFKDTRYFYKGMEMTGYSSDLTLGYKTEIHDTTKFKAGGSRWKTPGLTEIDFSSSGYWDVGSTQAVGVTSTGWDAEVDCTITSQAGGFNGNYSRMDADAGAQQYAYKTFDTKPGKTYTISAYAKDDTESGQACYIAAFSGSVGNTGTLLGKATATTTAAWVQHTFDFVAIAEFSNVTILKDTTFGAPDNATGSIGFDEVVVNEKSGEPDSTLFAGVGGTGTDEVITIAPNGVTEGNISYFFNTTSAMYMPGGSVGELLMYDFSTNSVGTPLSRGVILAAKNATTATASSTGQDLRTGTAATSNIRAALHVLSVSGTAPTLACKIQQDTQVAFGDSPSDTTGGGFTTTSTVGSEYLNLTGVTTGADDCFRVNYALGGTNPSFNFIVSIEVI